MNFQEVSTHVINLTGVELRKVVVTRWTRWFLIGIVITTGLSAFTTIIGVALSGQYEFDFAALFPQYGYYYLAFITSIIPIHIFTSDWRRREMLTMFTFVPQRGRIFVAKLVATIIVVLLISALLVFVTLVTTWVWASKSDLEWKFGDFVEPLRILLFSGMAGALSGAAIASALLSAPLSIVYMIMHIQVVTFVLFFLPEGLLQYMNPASFINFLLKDGELLPAIFSAVIWIVVPFVYGFYRNSRKEVS